MNGDNSKLLSGLKPGLFLPKWATAWFLQAEAIFRLSNIDDDRQRILFVLSWLDLSVLSSKIIFVPLSPTFVDSVDSYKDFKDLILNWCSQQDEMYEYDVLKGLCHDPLVTIRSMQDDE